MELSCMYYRPLLRFSSCPGNSLDSQLSLVIVPLWFRKQFPSVSKLMLWREKTQLWPRMMLIAMLLVAIDLLKPLQPLSNHRERHTALNNKFPPRQFNLHQIHPSGHRHHWPEFVHFSRLTCWMIIVYVTVCWCMWKFISRDFASKDETK